MEWYAHNGRHDLPWRTARDPYYTLVSEIMLQQTQVDRVIGKFAAFVERFPDFRSLADASAADVLREWKGLGYNSRALRLKRVAEAVIADFAGAMPSDTKTLRDLPGIGAYTASAIRAFAFDLDDAPLDTNIRRIVHRLFFGLEYPPKAPAMALDERARALAAPNRAHDWNSALMDLGATICTARAPKCMLCPLRDACAAAPIDPAALEAARAKFAKPPAPQNAIAFERTTRYARGRVVDRLRELPPDQRISLLDLHACLAATLPGRSVDDVRAVVSSLARDGLVADEREGISLRD